MDGLIKYDLVNRCASLKELADVIRSFANDEGMIKGHVRDFDAERMATRCSMIGPTDKERLRQAFNYGQTVQAYYIICPGEKYAPLTFDSWYENFINGTL